jgi:sialic acid synthase SpsE/mannose-6-phosphate isomerase-like protein (cupin superfamily)
LPTHVFTATGQQILVVYCVNSSCFMVYFSLMLNQLTPEKPLIILDLANNHDGSLDHGKRIVDLVHKTLTKSCFKIAIKFQYRDLPEFIHPDFRQRLDHKYVNRFISTRLDWDSYFELKKYVQSAGFMAACTPFDSNSFQKVKEHEFDILKIASASFTDWHLLESIQDWQGPTILSTAGADFSDIDRVVTFMQNRNKEFALMHCVAIYPTLDANLQLNRISQLKSRYPSIPIGYSTHEDPSNVIAGPIALAKGAVVLERHIGSTEKGHVLNAYSSSDSQLEKWHDGLKAGIAMLGSESSQTEKNPDEQKSLRSLRRYAFSKGLIKKGEQVSIEQIFLAFPGEESGITANEFGRYQILTATKDVSPGEALSSNNVKIFNPENQIFSIRSAISKLIKESGVVIPQGCSLEISHHYGLENFNEYGTCMITVVNREYCKKLLISLPGQTHPDMFHKIKDETFFIVYGSIMLKLDEKVIEMNAGDLMAIPPNSIHGFFTLTGCVIEEVSSSHNSDDSFYIDEKIVSTSKRKTIVKHWL